MLAIPVILNQFTCEIAEANAVAKRTREIVRANAAVKRAAQQQSNSKLAEALKSIPVPVQPTINQSALRAALDRARLATSDDNPLATPSWRNAAFTSRVGDGDNAFRVPLPSSQPKSAAEEPVLSGFARQSDGDAGLLLKPSRVRTLVVRPDGTIVSSTSDQNQLSNKEKIETEILAANENTPRGGGLPVAQNAILYEEGSTPAENSVDAGRVIWSVVQEEPATGQSPEPAIRARIEISPRNMVLLMTIKRNADKALPASHLIELVFAVPDDFAGGGISQINRFVLKQSEQGRGENLIGVPARVADGYFLIALNNLDEAKVKNENLLQTGYWFDIPMQYRTGRRALMTIEKGVAGASVFAEVFSAWTAMDEKLIQTQVAKGDEPLQQQQVAHNSSLKICKGTYWDNCFGTYTWPNGERYVGEWKSGQYHGQGTYTYSDNTKYVGGWKDFEWNGQGTRYAANGTILEQGIYKNGKRIHPTQTQVAKIKPKIDDKSPTIKDFLDGISLEIKRNKNLDKYIKLIIENRINISKLSDDSNIDYHLWDSKGRNILVESIKSENIELINSIIKNPLSCLECFDVNGDTPLIAAIKVQNINIVEKLIDAGASVQYNSRPCYSTVSEKKIDFLGNKLVEREACRNFHGPLIVAIKNHQKKIANILVSKGANIQFDHTLLNKIAPAEIRRIDIELLLIGKSINENEKKFLLYYYFLGYGSADQLRYFLSIDANLNRSILNPPSDRWGSPLSQLAGSKAEYKKFEVLIEYGADPAWNDGEAMKVHKRYGGLENDLIGRILQRPMNKFVKAQEIAKIEPKPDNSTTVYNDNRRKVALVIGNDDYAHAVPLDNPKNDARAMSSMLKKMGFKVFSGTDLDHAGMLRQIREFVGEARQADIALAFYAGHGIQVGGQNYLIPVDARLEEPSAIDFELINVSKITNYIGGLNKVGIILLDACRDNPFARKLSRSLGTRSAQVGSGLAQIRSEGGGLLVGFATAPDDVAVDGDGKNSPFTTALLKHFPTSGMEVQRVMTRVKAEVIKITKNDQRPWHNSDLAVDVFLAGK